MKSLKPGEVVRRGGGRGLGEERGGERRERGEGGTGGGGGNVLK